MPAYPDQTYEFSCWFLLNNDNYRSPYLKIEMLDSAGAVTQLQDVLTKAGRDNEGMWFRAGLWFTAPPQCSRIRIRMAGDNPADYTAIDELLIRPIETTVFSKNAAGVLMVNNHKLGGE